jgi:hypothetical protein
MAMVFDPAVTETSTLASPDGRNANVEGTEESATDEGGQTLFAAQWLPGIEMIGVAGVVQETLV